MQRKLIALGSIIGLHALLLPQIARANSIDELKVQLTAIESQVKLLEMRAQKHPSPAGTAELNEIKKELSQFQAQLAKAEAQTKAQAEKEAGYAAAVAHEPKTREASIPILRTPSGSFFIHGRLDAGIRTDFGPRTAYSIGSGLKKSSRLRFEGYRNIGQGFRVTGAIDGGLNLATGSGASNPPGTGSGFTFGRFAAIGIGSHRTGYLHFGRMYSPLWVTAVWGDPFLGHYTGGLVTVAPTLARTNRVSKAVIYTYGYNWQGTIVATPAKGLNFGAMYSPGSGGSVATGPAGRELGATISYLAPKWWLGAGYTRINGSDSTRTSPLVFFTPANGTGPVLNMAAVDGYYNLPLPREIAGVKSVQLFAGFNFADNGLGLPVTSGGVDTRSWYVGWTIWSHRKHVLHFMYGQSYDLTPTKGYYSSVQLGYSYHFTKHTSWYIGSGVVLNNAHSAATLLGAQNTLSNGLLTRDGKTPADGATGATVDSGFLWEF